MTKTKLYTPEQIYDANLNKENDIFASVVSELNEKRLNSDYMWDSFCFYRDDLKTEIIAELEPQGISVDAIYFEDHYGVHVTFEGVSADVQDYIGSVATPLDKLLKKLDTDLQKSIECYKERSISTDKLLEDHERTKKEIAEKYEKSYFWKHIFKTDEEIEWLDDITNYHDYTFEVELFDRSNQKMFAYLENNNFSAYDRLKFLMDRFESLPKEIQMCVNEYKLEFILRGEDSEFIDSNYNEIYKIEQAYFKPYLETFEQRGHDYLDELESDVIARYRDLVEWYESDEYYFDEITSNFSHFENSLFDENGNYVCEVDDLERSEENPEILEDDDYYYFEIAS